MNDSKKTEAIPAPSAKPKIDPTLAEAMRLVAEQMIPAAVAAAVAATSGGQRQAAPHVEAAPSKEKCHDCGQVRATGCKGEHVEMVVFPTRYPHHADYFRGVQLNGVTYLSNDAGHKVLVPANAESTIAGIVATFEQNEQDQAMGRKAERHSGTVSPHGNRVNPATAAWR